MVQTRVAMGQAEAVWPDQARSSCAGRLEQRFLASLTVWPDFCESATEHQCGFCTNFRTIMHCLNAGLRWESDHCQVNLTGYVLQTWMRLVAHNLCFSRIDRIQLTGIALQQVSHEYISQFAGFR